MLAGLALCLWTNPGLAAGKKKPAAKTSPSPSRHHGASGAGLLSPDPKWSLGVQVGTGGGTGIEAQNVGLLGGGLNLGLGFGGGSMSLHGDYVLFLGQDFHLLHLSPSDGYGPLKGQFTPYFGGGVQYGDGLALRVPLGVQYGMRDQPFNFFAAVVLVVGPVIGGSGDMGLDYWISAGARVLL